MARALSVLLLISMAASFAVAGDIRRPPSMDDLFDPDLIELDLDAIIAEQEKLWSFSFKLGSAQNDLATTEQQAENIATLKLAYDALAAEFENATGINIEWSQDSFESLRPVLDMYASVRYKLPERFVLPRVGGRLGVEMQGGRTGTSTNFYENGFGAAIADEAWLFGGRFLYFLPASLTASNRQIFRGVEKREIYFGVGAARAWVNHSVEVYMPDPNFQGIGDFYDFQATGNTTVYEFLVGVEEYFTPYLSLNLQVGYQSLKKGDLRYVNPQKVEDADILINEDEIATVWGPWFPEAMVPFVAVQQNLQYGWDRGEDSVVIDFTGFNFRLGLRYHY